MDDPTPVVVYIKTIPLSSDRDALHLAYDFHYYWQGSAHHGIYKGWMDDIWIRGRVIEPASALLLDQLARVTSQRHLSVKVVDTGAIKGWVRAQLAGVSRTPAIRLNGRLFRGEAGVNEALERLAGQASLLD